jgi:hypothetical protein
MDRWLLVRGTGEHPLPERVTPGSLRRHSSTRRPSVQTGDLAICYASRWQVVFALVEVTSDPENDPGRDRWRWRFPLRVLAAVPRLSTAPPVEAAGVFPRSLGRHSYIRLSEDQFAAGKAAIEAAAGAE